MTKKCLTCLQVLPLSSFQRRRRGTDKVMSRCMPCYAPVLRAQNHDWHVRNPIPAMLKNVRKRAKDAGMEFALAPSDIHIPDVCPVLGIPLTRGNVGMVDNAPSLDRVDNTKGYTPDNVWVISWRANSIKRDSTLDELKALVRALSAKQGKV